MAKFIEIERIPVERRRGKEESLINGCEIGIRKNDHDGSKSRYANKVMNCFNAIEVCS